MFDSRSKVLDWKALIDCHWCVHLQNYTSLSRYERKETMKSESNYTLPQLVLISCLIEASSSAFDNSLQLPSTHCLFPCYGGGGCERKQPMKGEDQLPPFLTGFPRRRRFWSEEAGGGKMPPSHHLPRVFPQSDEIWNMKESRIGQYVQCKRKSEILDIFLTIKRNHKFWERQISIFV